jgi:hypothetical protein
MTAESFGILSLRIKAAEKRLSRASYNSDPHEIRVAREELDRARAELHKHHHATEGTTND